MKVKSIVSFTSLATGELDVWPVGRIGEMSPDADWLRLGWVVEVEPDPAPAAEAGDEPDILLPSKSTAAAKRPPKSKKGVSDGG